MDLGLLLAISRNEKLTTRSQMEFTGMQIAIIYASVKPLLNDQRLQGSFLHKLRSAGFAIVDACTKRLKELGFTEEEIGFLDAILEDDAS